MKGNTVPRVLVVDDENSICMILQRLITKHINYACDIFSDPIEALESFKPAFYSAAIIDVRMPKMDGLTLLTKIREQDPELPVVVLTASDQWETAVNALRLGAFNFITKPFEHEDVSGVLQHAVESYQLAAELRQAGADSDAIVHIIGSSAPIRRVLEIIKRVSPTDSTVMVSGESGTGKELVARAIHLGSPRMHHPFVAVNCGAFPDSLLESELFGHLRGSFTSAVSDKIGMFEIADKGTFFLDEVGDTSQIIQVKLLRVLETREIRPVGGTTSKKVDARIIAATNRNMEDEVAKGNFRFDLYYRLNVIPIHIPPLRERKSDIPLLVGFFVSKFAARTRRKLTAANISQAAWRVLEDYPWPGNVRELENVISRAFTLMRGTTIEPDDLGLQYVSGLSAPVSAMDSMKTLPQIDKGFDLDKVLSEVEVVYIQRALEATGGSLTEAAKVLGVSFRTLRYKVSKYCLRK
ncbi:MAG: sigma-54 dependent transcriptional regulator [Candidatus Brocadiia bacterium]